QMESGAEPVRAADRREEKIRRANPGPDRIESDAGGLRLSVRRDSRLALPGAGYALRACAAWLACSARSGRGLLRRTRIRRRSRTHSSDGEHQRSLFFSLQAARRPGRIGSGSTAELSVVRVPRRARRCRIAALRIALRSHIGMEY